MSFNHWLSIAIFTAAPIAFAAQDKVLPVDPADPAAVTVPFKYESAFAGFRATPEEQETPDTVWRAANTEMGRLGGHAGQINSLSGADAATDGPKNSSTPQQKKSVPADHGGHGTDH